MGTGIQQQNEHWIEENKDESDIRIYPDGSGIEDGVEKACSSSTSTVQRRSRGKR